MSSSSQSLPLGRGVIDKRIPSVFIQNGFTKTLNDKVASNHDYHYRTDWLQGRRSCQVLANAETGQLRTSPHVSDFPTNQDLATSMGVFTSTKQRRRSSCSKRRPLRLGSQQWPSCSAPFAFPLRQDRRSHCQTAPPTKSIVSTMGMSSRFPSTTIQSSPGRLSLRETESLRCLQ